MCPCTCLFTLRSIPYTYPALFCTQSWPMQGKFPGRPCLFGLQLGWGCGKHQLWGLSRRNKEARVFSPACFSLTGFSERGCISSMTPAPACWTFFLGSRSPYANPELCWHCLPAVSCSPGSRRGFLHCSRLDCFAFPAFQLFQCCSSSAPLLNSIKPLVVTLVFLKKKKHSGYNILILWLSKKRNEHAQDLFWHCFFIFMIMYWYPAEKLINFNKIDVPIFPKFYILNAEHFCMKWRTPSRTSHSLWRPKMTQLSP